VTMVCGRGGTRDLQELSFDKSKGWFRGDVDGIDVIALPLNYSNHMGVAERLCVFVKYAAKSIRIALQEKCDIVFATSTPLTAAIPGIISRWMRCKPFIFEVRDLWPELPRAMGMKNPFLLGCMWILEGLAYRSANACIGLAPGIVEGIRRRSRKSLKVEMIPNGCDLNLYHPGLKTRLAIPGIEDGDFVAGYAGTLGRANGLDAILDCASELQLMGRSRIKILLVGDGSEKRRLVAKAESMGLRNVIFHEKISKTQLAPIIASFNCGLMVLDNIREFQYGTSPNKFFDYLSCGLPIVTNYPGWVSEVITSNNIGFSVPPGKPVDFAKALALLSDDMHMTSGMASRSRHVAESNFSRHDFSANFADFLEEVCGNV